VQGATLSKVNAIRKKALDCVQKRDWQGAIKEYRRLADLDQSNPNVFNELGDIYLKTGNKGDAYDAFTRAIDSYTRVSLHNNAVAVCKKVLRLIPSRFEVLTKLGLIRKKQGLGKEAESYYLSFLDQALVDQQLGPADFQRSCEGIAEEMKDSPAVLEKLYEGLVRFNFKDDAIAPLESLFDLYARQGDAAGKDRTRQRLTELGVTRAEPASDDEDDGKDGAVITEENIWNAAHTEGERIEVGEGQADRPESTPVAAADDRPDSVFEYGDLDVGKQEGEGLPSAEDGVGGAANVSAAGDAQYEGAPASTQTMDQPEAPDEAHEAGGAPQADASESETQAAEATDTEATEFENQEAEAPYAEAPYAEPDAGPEDIVNDPETGAPVYDITSPDQPAADADGQWQDPPGTEESDGADPETPSPPESTEPATTTWGPGIAASADNIHVSAIMGEVSDGSGELSEDDYRSHYDLGMAYLEMDLLAEAIREYQLAAKSEQFQARALEMIGLCFLNQNQATLAIKQLRKGLQLIGEGDIEALGIKYNLGLAYEMIGDIERAKSEFEDVYVEDVTFREVAKKIEKYS